ncbi:Voltage-gated potassium channel subunit beta-3 [Cichlidogyrus casuarinus]|uniref:Voltage-gated potassium channel subunit beta-3 n=1 Tax=Cichlidogyrus casuarinus TaxID=1844966 RepID=A0ABD2QM79_9PLAT
MPGTWPTFGGLLSEDVSLLAHENDAVLTLAYESGVNFFDTSESYANGNGGRTGSPAGQEVMEEVVLRYLHKSIRHFKRLQLDYVDIALSVKYDTKCPMEEIVRAFSYLVDSGKILYWGTSRWSHSEILEAHATARQLNLIPPTVEQSEYHMLNRDRIEVQFCEITEKIGASQSFPFFWTKYSRGPSKSGHHVS